MAAPRAVGRLAGLGLLLALLLPSGAGAGVTARKGIPFGRASGKTLRLDLYRSDRTPAHGARMIVWVHGGGFYEGVRGEIAPYAAEFARRGFVTATVDYRLHSQRFVARHSGWRRAGSDAQHDVQAAVRWARARAAALGVDEGRIYVGGYSAGAISSLRVSQRPEDPGRSGNPGVSSTVAGVISVAGGGELTSIDAGDPPALLLHGTSDHNVPFSFAVATLDAYRRARVSCTLVRYRGVGHELGVLRLGQRVFPAVARWLARH